MSLKSLAQKIKALKADRVPGCNLSEPIPNFVAQTIAKHSREKGKERESLARARKAESAAVSKILKKAAVLADFISDEDREQSMRVIREAKDATHRIYNTKTKVLDLVPDHKTRLAAVALERGYDEGLPVQRVLSGSVELESIDDTLARLRASPEAMKAIAGLKSAGVQLTIGDEAIDVDAEVVPDNPDAVPPADPAEKE